MNEQLWNFGGQSMRVCVGILALVSLTTWANPYSSAAGVRNAATCSATDVQAAINAAVDGDSVNIPAGSCTWTTPVKIDGSTRSLSVQGAGQNYTTITLAVAGDGDLSITPGAGKLFQLSNLKFAGSGSQASFPIGISGTAGDGSFRIHHVTFDSTGSTDSFNWLRFNGPSYGVIDHVMVKGPVQMFVNVRGGGGKAWGQPGGPGTIHAVFIEDSTFSFIGHNEGNPVFDSQEGGRVVFRHNTGTNITFGNHGADSGELGSLLVEIYSNSITLNDYNPGNCTWNITGGGFRAGQVVMYNNSWNVAPGCQFGTWGPGANIGLAVYRDGGYQPAWNYSCAAGNELKFCSQLNADWSGSIIDCKTDADCGGATCKWKMCSNSMTLCTADINCPSGEYCNRFADGGTSATSGHPCFNAPGTGVGNLSSPAYEWSNTMSGSIDGSGAINFGAGSKFLTAGVDYVNDTQKPGYIAQIYPHPLNTTGPASTKDPIPPGSVIVR